MIMSFEAPMGEGKTTSAVALAHWYQENQGRKVISNTPLNREFFPNYQDLDMEYFLKHMVATDEEMTNCVIIFDEMQQLMDSRAGQSKENRLFSYFVVQARKRMADLYICTHQLTNVDLRLRKAVDLRGTCRFEVEEPCKKCKGTGVFKDTVCDRCLGFFDEALGHTKCGTQRINFLWRRLKRGRRRNFEISFWGPNFWHLFDTYKRLAIGAKAFDGIETEMV